MRGWMVAAILWPGAALAWEPLSGTEIAAALTGQSLAFDALTVQTFHADGLTDHVTERFAVGRWDIRGDQYCSNWPPSEAWTCYTVEAEGDRIRFSGPGGLVSVGRFGG